MTETTTNDNSAADINEIESAIQAGIGLAGPRPLGSAETRFFTQVLPAGGVLATLDLVELEERFAPHPYRKQGTVHVQDGESFVTYLLKHGLPCTEVYADAHRRTLVGVINAHEESTPDDGRENLAGHGDHRVRLELIATDSWSAWVSRDKKFMEQATFAEHIEDNAVDIVSPDAATMQEIVESITGSTSTDFKFAERTSDGQVQFRYEETQGARAGQSGDLEIPSTFTLSLRPFEGADPVEVTARFRYRIRGGSLSLSYALLNPDLILRQAFLDHVTHVEAAIVHPVFQGRPE